MKTLLLVDWQNNDYQNSDKAHSGAAVINGSYLLEQWRKKGFNVVHVLTDCVKIWKSNQWRKQRFKSESPIVDNTILSRVHTIR